MRKLFVAFLLSPLFLACKKEKKECAGSPIPINIRLVTVDGKDWFNHSTPNFIDTANLSMTWPGNAIPATVFAYRITGTDSVYLKIPIYENWHVSNDYFLKLSNTDTDTITVDHQLTDATCGISVLTQFKYNNRVIVPGTFGGGSIHGFKVVKP